MVIDARGFPLLVNGRPDATVSAQDRGLAYGDGLFETVAVRDGGAELWPEHLARLREGCGRLAIPFPPEVAEEGAALCAGVGRGVLKIVVTRGVGGRGYRLPEVPRPTRVVSLHPWPDYPQAWWREGVAVRGCETPLGGSPRLAGIKHLNRLEQVLARAEWDDPAIAEGLMRDAAGRVVEGVMSNLFMVRGGALFTPTLRHCGVAGVMRGAVMAAAGALGVVCREAELEEEALLAADELFLSNSVIGIWPVARLDDRGFAVGPLTRRLQRALETLGVVR
ncbi:aminodeoxychorismate lyase [Endothiovibrio diazotrophicus]